MQAGVELRSPPATPDEDHSSLTDESTVHTSHNLHTENLPEIAATAGQPCRCAQEHAPEKISPASCIADDDERGLAVPDTLVEANCQPTIASAAAT